MVKNIDYIPTMLGPNIVAKIEQGYLQELLNIAVRAEAQCFLYNHRNDYDNRGMNRYIDTGKVHTRYLKTDLGTIKGSVPEIKSRKVNILPMDQFNSAIFPARTKTKRIYNSALVWRYLEGLATGDFRDCRSHLFTVMKEIETKRLAPWLERHLQASFIGFNSRNLANCTYPINWIDRVQLRGAGLEKNSRLFVAVGITLSGIPKLLGLYRSANCEDYLSWHHLFEKLKGQGLTELPPVTGSTLRDAIKGLQLSFPNYSWPRPTNEHIMMISSRLPNQKSSDGLIIIEELLKCKNKEQFNFHAARLAKAFLLSEPRLMVDFFNPEKYLMRLKLRAYPSNEG
jgi:hypothetical protein